MPVSGAREPGAACAACGAISVAPDDFDADLQKTTAADGAPEAPSQGTSCEVVGTGLEDVEYCELHGLDPWPGLFDGESDLQPIAGLLGGIDSNVSCFRHQDGGMPLCLMFHDDAAKGPVTAPQTGETTWISDSCGARDYPRVLVLKADQTFEAQDLVSPCPAKDTCVWSGIVEREGRWTTTDDGLLLTVPTPPDAMPGAADFPLSLALDEQGVPSEMQDGETCVYHP